MKKTRRHFMRICTASVAVAASQARLVLAQEDASVPAEVTAFPATTLVDSHKRPLDSRALRADEAYIFHYPYVTTPCFLIRLDDPNDDAEPQLVAYSAICSHKLSYPTRQVSFINYHAESVNFIDSQRQRQQQRQVIFCCSERSVYDAGANAQVLGGPAPNALPTVQLNGHGDTGEVQALGMIGQQRFEEFFTRFGFRLALDFGVADVRQLVGATSEVMLASEYSSSQRQC